MAYIISVSPSHLIARATEPRQTLCNPKLATNPQIYQILDLPCWGLDFRVSDVV
jgi:hypothetical protein